MAASDTGIYIANLAVRHQLSLFQRTLDRVNGRFNIDNDTFAHASRLVLTEAEHFKAALGQNLCDHSNDFAGADVEGDD